MSTQLTLFAPSAPPLTLSGLAPAPRFKASLSATAARPAPDAEIGVQFFLGAHRPLWLEVSPVPLFVSHTTLRSRRKLPRARGPWALDSGGFMELRRHGRFRDSSEVYAARVEQYQREIGQMQFASVQDWMCEPEIRRKTGLTVEAHQRRTVESYLALRRLAPSVPWMPVIQGWMRSDYEEHISMYRSAGVDLRAAARVGVGSICRRNGGSTTALRVRWILETVRESGIERVHAFGLKTSLLRECRNLVTSADSMAWSFGARRRQRAITAQIPERRTGGQNDLETALEWYRDDIAEPLRARA